MPCTLMGPASFILRFASALESPGGDPVAEYALTVRSAAVDNALKAMVCAGDDVVHLKAFRIDEIFKSEDNPPECDWLFHGIPNWL